MGDEQVVGLTQLTEVRASNWVGLATNMVKEIGNRGPKTFTKVNFIRAWLDMEKAWAIEGSRDEVREIITKKGEKKADNEAQKAEREARKAKKDKEWLADMSRVC